MKKLLISLLTLGSIASYAQEFNLLEKKIDSNPGKDIVKTIVGGRDYVGFTRKLAIKIPLMIAGAPLFFIPTFVIASSLCEDNNASMYSTKRALRIRRKVESNCQNELSDMIERDKASAKTHFCSEVYIVRTNHRKPEKAAEERGRRGPMQVCSQEQMSNREVRKRNERSKVFKEANTIGDGSDYMIYSAAILKH
jgi:hypothetical protein